MKVLVTGGNRGLGLELVKAFAPNSFSVSRSSGYDITQPEARAKIIELSLNFDVLVNNAFCGDFSQIYLLYECFVEWEKQKKTGHIFNISSYSTFRPKDERFNKELLTYVPYKHALDLASSQCSAEIEKRDLPFRVTNIRPSTLDTEKMRTRPTWPGVGHRGEDIAAMLRWFYEQPKYISFIDITLSGVKPENPLSEKHAKL